MKQVFQFLIGMIKSAPQSWCYCNANLVSIPYRYDKKFLEKSEAQEDKMFQFLIGMIKSGESTKQQKGGNAFQFLIGMIKSVDHDLG